MCIENNKSSNASDLFSSAESYVVSIVSKAVEGKDITFNSETSFGDFGVDSFHVLKIVKRLEEDFGRLPKTLLFEFINIKELTSYLLDSHQDTFLSLLGSPSTATPDDLAHSDSERADANAPVANIEAQAPTSPQTRSEEEVEVKVDTSPILIDDLNQIDDAAIATVIAQLNAAYKNEGTISRGTSKIAPTLFLGSCQRGYFNLGKKGELVLAYSYTGAVDGFDDVLLELTNYCKRHALKLNIMSDDSIHQTGDIQFTSTPFGAVQRVLNLQNFSLGGGKMRRLRYLVSKYEKVGEAKTVEYISGSDPDTDAQIGVVIDRWCELKTKVNPLVEKAKSDIVAGKLDASHRLFITYLDGAISNVILITAIQVPGNGYLMDLEFYAADMPLGGLEYAISQIIEQLITEGCELFSLGATLGPKLSPSENMDPDLDGMLDILRAQDIFDDQGNLQFKNKFRPENKTIFLSRPADYQAADDVIDVILMIAEPGQPEVFPAITATDEAPLTVEDVSATVTVATAADETPSSATPIINTPVRAEPISEQQTQELIKACQQLGSRGKALVEAGFNVAKVAAKSVEHDVKTDSWAKSSYPFIEQHVSGLHKHIQKAKNVHKQLATVFPFEHIICTKSGASAEAILCKAWPQKGVVLQNILFPTFIYSLLDNGFTPVELPHADIYDLNRASEHKAHIDITRLLSELDAQAQPVSFVGIEISNNASGGNAVSLGHLAELKKHLAARNIPLVMDATRIMENALNAPDGDASASIWQRARAICAHADVVTASLAKDFGINRGGILATNDPQLFKRFQDEADKSIDRMGLIDKKLVSLALADQEAASERLHTRQKQLATLRNTLTQAGIPLVQSSNAHCVLIDVKKLDSYAALAYPVESFLASLYLNAGIQAAGHNVGMQRDTALNNLVRVALPLGLSDHELNTIAHKMVDALSSPRHIVDINRVDADNGAFLSMGASYTPVRLLNAGGDDASSEAPSRDAEAVTTPADVAPQNTASHTPNKEVVASVSNAPQARDSEVGDIAIIGMAGRYPGADNLDQLWQNLVDSKDCITDIPQDRLDKRTASHKASYRGGFINNVDKFDSLFFNISPREAEMLDPQERLMLETAWEALEDGGYYPELLQNADGQNGKVGVFVGGVWSMYQILGVEQKMAGNPVTPNSFMWSLANRISYWMNLTGPSLTIDTACSSSLTAMYYACQSINKGDCQSAIVGGVNLDIHQHKYDINHNGGALSEDGVCRSFGANANGYVAGEGVNALYLKPLKQAIADKDNIHGVIRGIGVNHGGRTNGYTVPSPKSQANLISDVLAEAQINAATIGYVEAHGTGTELGDPIEITGLTRAFSADNVPAQSCAIGSIKTNIGHLEAAAGIAGVTKALLQMKHKTLVPSLHSAQLNEHIDFASSPFEVQQILAPWQPASLEGVEQPLRASISSFGAGGANAHLVIEAYNPVDTEAKSNDATLRLFPLSARTAQQLTQQAQRLLHFLEQDTPPPRLADIAFTLQMGRKAFDHRLAILASSQQQLIERLQCFIDTQAHSDVIVANTKDSKRVSGLLSTQENAEIIDMIASKGDPRKIATLWAEGFVDDLQFIKTDSPQRRVSLPLYPFADKRHWIEAHEAPLGTLDSIHPNIDSNESTFNAQVFTKSFTAKDFCIYDHLVSNIPTLPGVAYLDMARVTAEQALNRPVHKVYNVIWVSPLTVDGQNTTEAKVELIPKGNSVNFEIYGEADDQTRKVYCQGKIAYRGSASEEIPEEYIDIDAVKSRSALVAKGAESYPQFHELGLQLGPSFQVLQDVYKNDDEILGELQIPACRRDDFNRFILHPSLMDGSLQAGMAASLGAQSGTMYVPYSIGEVEVYHPLTERCFSYIQKVNEPHSKLSKANVTIVDETGRVLVKIKESIGVPLVDVHEKPSETASSVAETNEFEPLYYAYDWSEAELDCTARDTDNPVQAVAFVDQDTAQWLTQANTGITYVCVEQGDENAQLAADRFTVNPNDPASFAWLLAQLQQNGVTLERLCYAWTRNAASHSAVLETGLFWFHALCQALVNNGNNNLDVLYLYQSQADHNDCVHESVNGYIRTLQAEVTGIRGKVLALDPECNDVSAIAAQELLDRDFVNNTTVKYQSGTRLVRAVKQCQLGAETSPDKALHALKEKGVYLITGGLGGIGHIMARYLAKHYRATLILIGRSALDDAKSTQIDALKQLGSEVVYYQGSVSCDDFMAQLVAQCQTKYGAVHGVIHSAGALNDSLIRNKSRAEFEAVLESKVAGTLCLDNATRDAELDFFVTFSSMAAVGGNLGQGDYAFANHFMDTYCRHRAQQVSAGQRSGKSLSINWSIWKEGGMQLDAATEQFFQTQLGIKPLQSQLGIDAFLNGLLSDKSNFVVVDGKKEILEPAWGITKKSTPVAEQSTAADSPESVSPGQEVNNALVDSVRDDISEIVKDFLKLSDDELDTEALLLDLGFDSMALASFANDLNDKYGLEITPVMFFEYPNIEQVSAYIASQSPCSGHSQSAPVVATPQESLAVTAQPSHQDDTLAISINKGGELLAEPGAAAQQVVQRNPQDFIANRFIDTPIAIVGMSGVMPQSDDLDEFWRNLIGATDNMVTLVPQDRWDWQEYYGDPLEEENKTKSKWGGFMRNVDQFDPLFFGISPREAQMMDPQQRIFLQTVCGAIEDAGHKISDLAGTKTGLFVGASTREYLDLMGMQKVQLDGYSASGTSHAILANRVSYLLDIRGPSAPLDTACSSSLVALHRAIESIHTGSCDMAIVGGVQVMLTPAGFISFDAAGMLASDGRCKTFDEAANGYVRGEGSGAILIKTLADAKRDGDHVYALVRATAENHGGKASMLTAPNRKAQTDAIVEAYEKSGLDPRRVGFVECHGTGTSLGDPIEIDALKSAFDILYKKQGVTEVQPHIGLTSAKTNIGHLETAAGIAGLLKILLAIKHKQIPPLLHFNKLNPYINLEGSPLYIVDEPKEWQAVLDERGEALPRVASLSSFGFGGANVHVVFEEYGNTVTSSVDSQAQTHLFVLSAKNKQTLDNYVANMKRDLEVNTYAPIEIAHTLQVGRDSLECRVAMPFKTQAELIAKLTDYLNEEVEGDECYTGAVKKRNITQLDDKTLRNLLNNHDFAQLAELWCQGKNINWGVLYQDRVVQRLNLPTYPFSKESYWFEVPAQGLADVNSIASSKLHPLVHENVSTIEGVVFRSHVSDIAHLVETQVVQEAAAGNEQLAARISSLPCLLSMAKFSAQRALDASLNDGIELFGVELLPQHTCSNEGVFNTRLTQIASPDDTTARVGFKVTHETAEASTVHTLLCSGKAQKVAARYPASLHLDNLMHRTPHLLTQDELAIWLESGKDALMMGCEPAFAAVNLGTDEVFIELDAVQSDEPSTVEELLLLDTVFAAAKALQYQGKTAPKQPCGVRVSSVRFTGELAQSRFIWLKKQQSDKDGTSQITVSIADHNGTILATLNGLTFAPTNGPKPGVTDNQTALVSPQWCAYQDGESGTSVAASDAILLLGFDEQVAAQVQQTAPNAWCAAISECELEGLAYATPMLDFANSQIAAHGKSQRKVTVICNAGISPAIAQSIYSFLQSVKQEYSQLQSEVISLATAHSADDVLQLLAVSRTGFYRVTETGLEQQQWVKSTRCGEAQQTALYQDGGTYLITGGLGGLGMIFAKQILAETTDSHVILTGRGGAEDKQSVLAAAFGEQHARVRYVQMNLAAQSDVTQVIDDILAQRGQLSGIIHCAGMVDDSKLSNKSAEQVQAVLAPKVLGTLHLDQACAALELDFFLLSSSIVSVFGNAGQADYAMANGFLDGFAEQRNAQVAIGQRHGRTLSINWPLWESGGMSIPAPARALLTELTGMHVLPTHVGLEILLQAWREQAQQTLALYGDPALLVEMFAPLTCQFTDLLATNVAALSTQHSSDANSEQDWQANLLTKILMEEFEGTEY